MKCMTLNIWNFQHGWSRRREVVAALIVEHQPDIVALQEARHDIRFNRGRGQAEQIAELTGYHSTWVLGQVYLPFPRVDEGLTILTPNPPPRVMVRRLTRNRRLHGDGNQRVCLGVAIGEGSREVHFYTSHFALNPTARQRNALEVMQFVRQQSGDVPSILVGDLNETPEHAAIQFLLGNQSLEGETGDWIDCWPAVHPDDPGYTYASWEPVRRIDYVLARCFPAPPIAAQLGGDRPYHGVYASDHIGIMVDFAL